MTLACSKVFVCFYYSTRFCNEDLSSFKNLTNEPRLLRNDTLNLKINRWDLQTFENCVKNKSYLWKSTMTSIPVNKSKTQPLLNLSYWNPCEKTMWYCILHGTKHSGKKWCSELWLNVMYSHKKWFQHSYPLLYILLKFWLFAARLLRSLRNNTFQGNCME